MASAAHIHVGSLVCETVAFEHLFVFDAISLLQLNFFHHFFRKRITNREADSQRSKSSYHTETIYDRKWYMTLVSGVEFGDHGQF